MILHYYKDGSVSMILNIRGVRIEKLFSSYREYQDYLSSIK